MTEKKKTGTELLYSLIAEIRKHSDSIVLGRGDPDFDTPSHIIEAAHEAMQKHGNGYVPPEGIAPLREAIAQRVQKVNSFSVDPETEVVVTNGGQEAVFLIVMATMAEGEELIVPEPNYNTYNDSLAFARGVKVPVVTHPESAFEVSPEAVRAAITDKTRAMLLVSPNNPTAGIINEANVKALVDIAKEHDLIILADDIYDLFVYDDYKHISFASVAGARERTLTLNALSKAYSMTGWRLGWIVGPADLMARVKQLKAATTGGTSIVSQHAAIAALTGPQEPVQEMHEAYKRRRRIVLDALDEMEISYGMPQGGQFVFADIGFTGMDSADLARRIVEEQHVLAYPGSAFSPDRKNFLRMTFLQPEEKIREGLRRMKVTMDSIAAERQAN
ncbi:MAG: aminotransferase class I/II-fold pyridoxal phosphate-dependent enzyme [Chloroflexota bacterium]